MASNDQKKHDAHQLGTSKARPKRYTRAFWRPENRTRRCYNEEIRNKQKQNTNKKTKDVDNNGLKSGYASRHAMRVSLAARETKNHWKYVLRKSIRGGKTKELFSVNDSFGLAPEVLLEIS